MDEKSLDYFIAEIEDLLGDRDIKRAAQVITILFDRIKQETVYSFYSSCAQHLQQTNFLKEFADVFKTTGILPPYESGKVFINKLVSLLENNKEDESLRSCVPIAYELLVKYELPEFFVKLYGRLGIDPPVDAIYQAIMLARLKKDPALKDRICNTFEIID